MFGEGLLFFYPTISKCFLRLEFLARFSFTSRVYLDTAFIHKGYLFMLVSPGGDSFQHYASWKTAVAGTEGAIVGTYLEFLSYFYPNHSPQLEQLLKSVEDIHRILQKHEHDKP